MNNKEKSNKEKRYNKEKSDQSNNKVDYFSLHRNNANQQLSSSAISPGSNITSQTVPSVFFKTPKYANNRHPSSNLNFLLSPILTSPPFVSFDTPTSESNVQSASSSSQIDTVFKDLLHPSVLFELEEKANLISKDSTSPYTDFVLPHDYLNISLDKNERTSKKEVKDENKILSLLIDYELLDKIDGDGFKDNISHYIALHKKTNQKYVIRFASRLTVGSISRLVNSYYITSDYNDEKSLDKLFNMTNSSQWKHVPKTLKFNIDGVYACTKLDLFENEKAIIAYYPIEENFVPLNKLKFDISKDLNKLIIIFINILKIFKNVHSYGIVNNSIIPSDIFVNIETLKVSIIGFDFSFSSNLDHQKVPYRSANKSMSLNYIPFTAPENFQTLLPVDFRADIYGIGTVIYSIFSNKIIKQNSIFLLITTILTTKHTPLSDTNHSIPIEFSKIITKMIEIDIKSRYSSIDHIIHDLAKLYHRRTSKIIPHDRVITNTTKILITQPLEIIGREGIIKLLKSEISVSSVKTFTIAGETGIGKTSILESLRIPAMIKKMFFTTSKCHNQNYIESKFQTFDLILSQLLRDILSMDKLDIIFWRDLLSVEVKADLSILFETIPELKILLGPRYKHIRRSSLDKMIYQKELGHHYIIKKLFELFSRHAGWVLVIENIGELSETEALFLEELWIHLKNDFPAGELNITLLTSYTTTKGDSIQNNIPKFLSDKIIEVLPLSYENIERYLNLCLHLYDSQFLWKTIDSNQASYYYEVPTKFLLNKSRRSLAEFIQRLSKGNPLLIKEIINQLRIEQVKSLEILDPIEIFKKQKSIVEAQFLSDHGFPSSLCINSTINEDALTILKYAACICIGESFDMYDLLIVTAGDISNIYTVLYSGTIIEILRACSVVSKLPLDHLNDPMFPLNQLTSQEKNNLMKYCKFTFFHDTIQKHLLKLMEDSNELDEFHRNCGLRYFKKIEAKGGPLKLSSSECFSIAYHFMNSYKVARPEEYLIYSNVLITAGWSAYSSYEHISALGYFQTAQKLTEDKLILKGLEWVEIHIYALKNQHLKCIELTELALEKYNVNTEDMAQFMISKMQSLRALNKWNEAFDCCLKTLKVLEFPLDLATMTKEDIEDYSYTVLKPKLPTSLSEIHDLKNLENITDRKVLLIQMLMLELNQFSVYLGKSYLFPFANMMNVILFMENGKSIYCSLSMIVVASLDAAIDAKGLKRAREYCKLAFNILNYFSIESNELFIISFRWYCAFVGSIIEPSDKINQSFDTCVINSKAQAFETTFAKAIILRFKLQIWVSQGITIKNLLEKMELIKFMNQPQSDPNGIYDKIYKIVVDVFKILTNETTYENYLELGEGLDLKAVQMGFTYSMSKCFACYMMKKFELGADIALNELTSHHYDQVANIELPWGRYICVLLLYKDQRRRNKNNELQDDTLVGEIHMQLKKIQLFFKELTDRSTSIFTSMYLTVDTLIKVLNEKEYSQIDILTSFENAIDSCSENHNYLLEAIVSEECARWLKMVSKDNKLSNKFFKIAYNNYKSWGLTMKVDQLSQEFEFVGDIILDSKHSSYASSKRRNSKFYFQNDFVPFQQYTDSDGLSGSMPRSPSRRFSAFSSGLVAGCASDDVSSSFSRDTENLSNDVDSFKISANESVNSETDGCKNLNSNDNDLTTDDELNFNELNIRDTEYDADIIMELSTKITLSDDVEETIRILMNFSINLVHANYACFILNSEDGLPFVKAICLENDEVQFMSDEILSLRGDLVPVFLIERCMKTNLSIWRDSDKFYFDTTYKNRDSYFEINNCENVVCIPIRSGDSIIVGALYLENQRKSSFIPSKNIDLLEYFCLQSYISINKSVMVEKLQMARKVAEEATADRTNFLANMSHEIRTPFNSLMSCAIFLLDTELTESQRVYVETIKNSALVTLNIIDGILSFSKIEHGSLMLEYEPFNLNKCIESAVLLVAEQVSLKKLELVFIDDTYPIEKVYGDETRVIQIIINLLGNSTKFTNTGYICVHSEAHPLSKDRYEFIISVKDSGIGIPEGNKGRLFKAFSQLDGSSKREHGGSGLGLAISKKLAEYMGGDLDYVSKEGNGTEFKFTFTSKAEIEEIEKIDKNIKDNEIVVILDSRDMSSLSLKKYIQRKGFKDENIFIFNKLNTECENQCKNAKFVFIFYELLENLKEMERIRKEFKNAVITYEIPFGTKIPIFFDDSKDGMKLENNKSVDYILLNPFKREKVDQILEKRDNSNYNKIVDENLKSDRKFGEKYPLNILIAEDNLINTKVVKLQLKRLGYGSEHAKDGVEVIEMTENRVSKLGKPYDLILMDLQMPRKDGYEATIDIKAKYGEDVSVVALSANVYKEEKKKCHDLGMLGFLNKPLLPEALSIQLKNVFLRKTCGE